MLRDKAAGQARGLDVRTRSLLEPPTQPSASCREGIELSFALWSPLRGVPVKANSPHHEPMNMPGDRGALAENQPKFNRAAAKKCSPRRAETFFDATEAELERRGVARRDSWIGWRSRRRIESQAASVCLTLHRLIDHDLRKCRDAAIGLPREIVGAWRRSRDPPSSP